MMAEHPVSNQKASDGISSGGATSTNAHSTMSMSSTSDRYVWEERCIVLSMTVLPPEWSCVTPKIHISL